MDTTLMSTTRLSGSASVQSSIKENKLENTTDLEVEENKWTCLLHDEQMIQRHDTDCLPLSHGKDYFLSQINLVAKCESQQL